MNGALVCYAICIEIPVMLDILQDYSSCFRR